MAVKVEKAAADKVQDKPAAPQSKGPVFVQKVIKDDTYLVLSEPQHWPEDEFVGLYYSRQDTSKIFLMPPFEPKRLAFMVTQNNALSQCIDAMEVNIDGTGYELESVDPDTEMDKDEVAVVSALFDEPYPMMSMVTIRRAMRRELESIGYAALEVLRNVAGDVVGFRNVPGYSIRFVRLDDPVQVTKTITRNGKDVELTYWDRERRFAQRHGVNHYTYYREFGCTRHLDRETGDWEREGQEIPPERRGTELLVFRARPDVDTPYGIPRWINNLPSVIGSRKAEEQNLEFFDAGGMPPAIIFIEGGVLAADMANQLRMYLSGQMKNKHRAIVVEAQSSSGNLDSSGQVRTKVERFGAEVMKDSMYEKYDKIAQEHVRISFRLPPLFLGLANDYNYASAAVSYMVAEAQVFQPERMEFDEKINCTLLRAMGIKTCRLRSKPIVLKDAPTQVQALSTVKGMVEGQNFIEQVNTVAGLNLKFQQSAQMDENGQPLNLPKFQSGGGFGHSGSGGGGGDGTLASDFGGGGGGSDGPKPNDSADSREARTNKSAPGPGISSLLQLAHKYCVSEGLIRGKEPAEKTVVRKSVDHLHPTDREVFNRFVGFYLKLAIDRNEVAVGE